MVAVREDIFLWILQTSHNEWYGDSIRDGNEILIIIKKKSNNKIFDIKGIGTTKRYVSEMGLIITRKNERPPKSGGRRKKERI